MLNLNLKTHPYEVKYNALVADAKVKTALRMKQLQRTPPKPIEPHIFPKWDDNEEGYGMYNARLESWVREEFETLHHTFATPEQAKNWYRGLI